MNFKLLCSLVVVLALAACGPSGWQTGDSGSNVGTDGGGAATGGGSGDAGTDAGVQVDAGIPTVPTVISTLPFNGALNVSSNSNVSAVFSEPMDVTTLNTAHFLLTTGRPAIAVAGTVTFTNNSAAFWPSAHLAGNTTYTATITTGARSEAGVALALNHVWSFATGAVVAPQLPVNLGMAGNFVILAKSAVSTVPASNITGNIGLSPAAASYITGFSMSADASNVFSTSSQVTGQLFAADYTPPTPSNMTTTVSDMELAFTDAAGRAADVTELGAGDISGATLTPGVYKWSSGLLLASDLTLNGSATDVWIFQIAQNLTVSNGVRIVLAGGAVPKNIFWQVSGEASFGTSAHLEGIVLSQTLISLNTGATANGRLLAQTAVTLDAATVVAPAM